MSDNNTNSNTPSSNKSGSGGNTLSTHTFQPNIKVNFANQQISLNSKFIESVSTKIKQLKEEANNEQDNQKKLAIINKYQNIEAMLKSSLMEYKQKFQQQQQQQQQQSNNSNSSNSNSNSNSNNSNTPGNPISIKNYLTDEQKLHYANINKQFQQKTQQIVSTFDNNKKELEKILEKIKITNPETMKKEMDDLLAMKTKHETNGKTLQAAYKNLEVQMSDLKKRFYLKCSESNPELKKALMMVQMSQQQKQQQQQQAAAQQSSSAQQQQSATQQPTPQQSTPQQPQPQPQNKKQSNTASTQSKNVNTATPQQPPTTNSSQKKQKTAPTPTVNSQKQQLPQTSGDNILKPTIHENSLLTDVSTNITPVPIKEIPYKKDATQPTISAGYLGSNPILSQPLNRVLPQQASTANNNNATTAAVPTGKKNAYVPTPQDHILTKRKLRDLLKQYNGNSANIDGDVEELLLDLSDNFIEQVVKFGGKVAKLRKSENLEVKDVKFALEKGFGLEL